MLVDGWRQEAAVDRQGSGDDAGCTARPLWVADHRFHRGSREPIRVAPKELTHAARFDGIVEHGRGAMVVDVTDGFAVMARPLDRHRDGANDLFAARRHLHAVVRVAGRRIAVY